MPTSVAEFYLTRQIGQIGAARGLPRAIEIVMHQFAALAFADHVGKPVGGGEQAGDFAARRLQLRGGIKLGIGDGVERIGYLSERPYDCARDRQDHGARYARKHQPDEDFGIGFIRRVQIGRQHRGQEWHRQHGGQRQQHGRSKPFGDCKLPHAPSLRTAPDFGIGSAWARPPPPRGKWVFL